MPIEPKRRETFRVAKLLIGKAFAGGEIADWKGFRKAKSRVLNTTQAVFESYYLLDSNLGYF